MSDGRRNPPDEDRVQRTSQGKHTILARGERGSAGEAIVLVKDGDKEKVETVRLDPKQDP